MSQGNVTENDRIVTATVALAVLATVLLATTGVGVAGFGELLGKIVPKLLRAVGAPDIVVEIGSLLAKEVLPGLF